MSEQVKLWRLLQYIIDAWTGNFETDREWKKKRIPFESLMVGRGWIKKGVAKYGQQAHSPPIYPSPNFSSLQCLRAN
ncbi:MAG: hypothetical protein SRB1_00559 [Desulfobacteraceae bacterium Eth-SRB1]|nr:MAG: hypothetical protein SRB1_00559 [Desulfobacteraceae bacterium Eth-SRB1]